MFFHCHLPLYCSAFPPHVSPGSTASLRCPFLTSTVVALEHNSGLHTVRPFHSDAVVSGNVRPLPTRSE